MRDLDVDRDVDLDVARDDQPGPASIGMFDSGVGGLSVWRELCRRLPGASMIYVGDVAFAPYGARPAAQLQARCERIVDHLASQGARLIVVACNTATVQAIDALRERWPSLAFVGVEPGIKPAVAVSRSGRIAVMATAATLQSARLRHLVDRHAAGASVLLQPCPGLADAIEAGALDGPALMHVLMPYCDRIRQADVDTVVLGCTHYAFVTDAIRRLLGPRVTLIDTAAAVAEQAAKLWCDAGAPGAPGAPGTSGAPLRRVQSTGGVATMRRLLLQCPGSNAGEVEALTL